MFIVKKDRIAVYSYLFKEGVLVVKKDAYKPKHDEIEVHNNVVINLLKSLKSRGLVRETFNWQWFYYYLTNEGIDYLREYLHLPAEVVPATLKKTVARPGSRQAEEEMEQAKYGDREGGGKGGKGGFGRGGGDRDGYRSERPAGEGGFGRGGGGKGGP